MNAPSAAAVRRSTGLFRRSSAAATGLWSALVVVACGGVAVPSETVVRTEGWRSRVVVDDMPDLVSIAIRPNGQSILAIDGATRSVVAIETDDPTRRRTALAPLDGKIVPLAIACVDSSTIALLGRDPAGALSLATYRLQPSGETPAASVPIQSQPVPGRPKRLATAGAGGRGDAGDDAIAVSAGRDWLVLARGSDPSRSDAVAIGDAEPPILRAPIAGSRLGPLGTRHCPGHPAAAVTVSPEGALVLLEPVKAGDELVFYARSAGYELLRLSTGLTDAVAMAYGRDGTLWAAASAVSDGTSGLWRLDATMLDGRQSVRSTCVAELEHPVAIVAVAEEDVAVLAGAEGDRRLLFIGRAAAPTRGGEDPAAR